MDGRIRPAANHLAKLILLIPANLAACSVETVLITLHIVSQSVLQRLVGCDTREEALVGSLHGENRRPRRRIVRGVARGGE